MQLLHTLAMYIKQPRVKSPGKRTLADGPKLTPKRSVLDTIDSECKSRVAMERACRGRHGALR